MAADTGDPNGDAPSLRREMSTLFLTVYGVGGMLGGGIYALVGEVAGHAGTLAWAAFAVAMATARFPRGRASSPPPPSPSTCSSALTQRPEAIPS